MTNPTSNFGWQMPEATDLVTNLPADFEVFGQAVDTDFADLNGGTAGQVLSKTSGADLDFTWIANDQGDITGVTAGTGISGGGTSGTVTVTNDMATTITAAGDIVVGTGSGTYDNLPIGTTAQVLTADTTVSPYKVKWATPAAAGGGMTLINTGGTTLTGASITISSIPSTYKHLFVLIENVYFASNNGALYLRPNSSGSTNYAGGISVGGGVTTDTTFSAGGEFVVNLNNTTNNTAKQKTQSAIWIYDYAGASNKFISCQTMAYNGAWNTTTTNGVWVDTTALSSLRTYGDYDFTDGTIYVYGVN